LDLTKSGWRELNRPLKEYANSQEPTTHEREGGVPFIGIKKLAVGVVRGNRSNIPIRPV
jgi:hypothetical protein